MSSGSTHDSTKAITNIFSTLLDSMSARLFSPAERRYSKNCGTSVMPKPRHSDRESISTFFCENPALANIFMPTTAMEPNSITIAPPSTHCGMVSSTFAATGNSDTSSSKTAPISTVKRFTTFVWVTIPTFCAKVVSGSAPNRLHSTELNPSVTTVPVISRVVGCLPSTSVQRAVQSPMPSTTDIKKYAVVRAMGTASNFILVTSARWG